MLQQYTIRKPKTYKKKPFKYDIGQTVKIPYKRGKFDRVYNVKWSGEILSITKRYRLQNINQYKLKGYDGIPVDGSFYEWELQKVSRSANPVYRIDKVIATKGTGENKQAFVSWMNWPDRYNSWVAASDITNL